MYNLELNEQDVNEASSPGVNETSFTAAGQAVGQSTPINLSNDLITWERSLLQRERELLDRERQILMQSAKVNQVSQIPASSWVRPDDHVLPEFDPCQSKLNAAQWVRKLENVSAVYGWDDKTLLFFATSKLRGAARFWFESLAEEVGSWREFSAKITASFPSSFDQAEIHMELMRRTKKSNEPYEVYIYEMAAIANRGQLDDTSTMKYIISGLEDQDLMRSLALCEIPDLQELLLRIKRYESLKLQVNMRREVGQPTFKNFEVRAPKKEQAHCFNCGLVGHKAPECENNVKGKKCFACNEFGHIAANCPDKRRAEKRSMQVEAEDRQRVKTNRMMKEVDINGTMVKSLIDTENCVNLVTRKTFSKLGTSSLTNECEMLTGLDQVEVERQKAEKLLVQRRIEAERIKELKLQEREKEEREKEEREKEERKKEELRIKEVKKLEEEQKRKEELRLREERRKQEELKKQEEERRLEKLKRKEELRLIEEKRLCDEVEAKRIEDERIKQEKLKEQLKAAKRKEKIGRQTEQIKKELLREELDLRAEQLKEHPVRVEKLEEYDTQDIELSDLEEFIPNKKQIIDSKIRLRLAEKDNINSKDISGKVHKLFEEECRRFFQEERLERLDAKKQSPNLQEENRRTYNKKRKKYDRGRFRGFPAPTH